jgi:hypothetical protein
MRYHDQTIPVLFARHYSAIYFSHEILCRFFLAELLDIPRDRAGFAIAGLKRLPVYVPWIFVTLSILSLPPQPLDHCRVVPTPMFFPF